MPLGSSWRLCGELGAAGHGCLLRDWHGLKITRLGCACSYSEMSLLHRHCMHATVFTSWRCLPGPCAVASWAPRSENLQRRSRGWPTRQSACAAR